MDYSKVRKAGEPLKAFGGTSAGPEPLMDLHASLIRLFDALLSESEAPVLRSRHIVDIMNLIGKCVVAGNIRRTAEIAFGEFDDEEFIDLKNYEKNPERLEYGWVSNNSIFAELGMDYNEIGQRIIKNGEPGIAWLENMQKYGRMNDPPNNLDYRARGGNPCLEQTLESHELCCLVETFPVNHNSLPDYLDTLELAFLYAKSVTLGLPEQWPQTYEVMHRNRRIGTSMSGIAQFLTIKSKKEFI